VPARERERESVPAPDDVASVRPLPVAPSDRELVERCLGGDRWAEEALYRKHVHRVSAVVARMLRHGPDVEDVVQDTFVQALGRLASLRDPAKLERWLITLAVNRVKKRFRRRKLRRLLGLERSFDDEGLALQAKATCSQEARAELMLLDRALDRLPSAERICWVLRRVEDYPMAEVVALAGCSLATAKRRIARADETIARLRSEAS
jgi:RNA polymerase sigma-70 factor (ECF subfamily)